MYTVTQDFLNKIKANERQVFGRLTIDYTDPFLDQSIQCTANESANVSFPAQTVDAVSEPFAKIASLDGSWVLDGSFALAPDPEEADTHQMGWWGSQLSQADGTFVQPYPTLTVTHFPRPIHSLKVVGDSKRGEYPVDFHIDLYGPDDTLLYTENVSSNAEVVWNKTLAAPVLDVAKQVLTITKWSHPGRQAKILEFFTSIQETYEGDDVLLIHLLEEREVSQGSLPVGNISANEIDIRLSNETRKFDAGNTQSPLYQLLKQNRRIRAWLGVEAENNYSENPPTFSRNSIAYLSDGTQVAANVPRFEPGRFGQAVMVEEGTTNVCTNGSFESNLTGWTFPTGQYERTSQEKYFGSYSLKLTNPDSSTNAQAWFSVPNPSSYAGKTVTVTVYAKTDRPYHGKLEIREYDGSTYKWTGSNWHSGSGQWEKLTLTMTFRSTVTDIQIQLLNRVGFGDNTPTSVYFDGVLFEQKPYATSFIDGTRSPESLTIPTEGVLNSSAFTIEMWMKQSIVTTSAFMHAKRFLDLGQGLWLWNYSPSWTDPEKGDTSNARRIIADFGEDASGVRQYLDLVSSTPFSTTDFEYFAVTFDGTTFRFYRNGVLWGSKKPSKINPFTQIVLKEAGWIIDDLRISKKARTDEEIAAAYASGQPLPVDEWTTYKLTFNGSIYPVEKVWVPLGTFWSGDWSAPEDDIYAQTTGRDRLELLRKSTYSTSQVQQNKTLYDLALAVLEDAGLKPEEYWVDPELQQYLVPYSYFEPQSHREALRKIAEACLGQVYCDRDGIVRVEGPSYLAGQTEAVLEIGPDDYFRKDNPVKWSEIANYIEVETQPLRPVDTPQEVYRSNEPVSIAAGQTISITAYYNETPCIDAVASLENAPTGCVIQDATYYAWGADVKVYSPNAGTFTLVINARLLKVLNKERAVAKDDASITDNGMIKYTFPANPLVQTREVAQDIANKLLEYYKNPRRDVEVEWRGNPALLLGDRVKVTDKNEQNDYYAVRQELEYSGAMRAKLSGRRAS